MPPPELHPNHHHHLLRPPLHRHHHRSSTAQSSLLKILHTISVFSAGDIDHKQQSTIDETNCANNVLNIDLNISLHLPTEIELIEPIEPIEPPITMENGGDAANCSSENNNNNNNNNNNRMDESYDLKQLVEDHRRTEDSEISHVGDRSSEIDNNGVSDGYLGLLIEAAELILIDHESKPRRRKESSPPVAAEIGGGAKRRWTVEWWPEIDGASPAVRSKRGRSVVLPEKYRDSVVEPLVRWTPSRRRR